MGGHGAVAQGGHLPHQGGIAAGDIHLVGHRACGQEGGGVAGEELVLRVGGGAAEHGGVGVALNGVLRQGGGKGMASVLLSTPGSTERSERDSFMMTMTFTGRIMPSSPAAGTATGSLGALPARAARASSE